MTELAKIDQERLPSVSPNPMQMVQTAIEKGVDATALASLMDLQERWEKNEAKKAFVAAMQAFKADPPELVKTKTVRFGKEDKTAYKHATLDQVSGVIGAALEKQGITHAWKPDTTDPTKIKVTCILTHIAGHSEETSLSAPADNSGSKNSIQAVGSTVTYLQRYTLLAATGLAVKDQDSDAFVPPAPIDAKQKAEIIALIREIEGLMGENNDGKETQRFLTHLQVQSIDDLTGAQFPAALAALKGRRAQL